MANLSGKIHNYITIWYDEQHILIFPSHIFEYKPNTTFSFYLLTNFHLLLSLMPLVTNNQILLWNILSDSTINCNGVPEYFALSLSSQKPIKIIFVVLTVYTLTHSVYAYPFHQLIQNNVFNSMETTTNIIVFIRFDVILYNQIIKPHDSFPQNFSSSIINREIFRNSHHHCISFIHYRCHYYHLNSSLFLVWVYVYIFA